MFKSGEVSKDTVAAQRRHSWSWGDTRTWRKPGWTGVNGNLMGFSGGITRLGVADGTGGEEKRGKKHEVRNPMLQFYGNTVTFYYKATNLRR